MTQSTTITPPRVPLIDERTGLISREWFRFFLNLFVLTGSGTTTITVLDVHDTVNLNLATQSLAHHQEPPQGFPICSDQSMLAIGAFGHKQHQDRDIASDQEILSA